MANWRRVLQVQVFPEDAERASGPVWARYLLLIAATIGYVALAVTAVAILSGNQTFGFRAWALFVGAFALMSGAAWHLKLRARAKNGLILAMAFTALLVLATKI